MTEQAGTIIVAHVAVVVGGEAEKAVRIGIILPFLPSTKLLQLPQNNLEELRRLQISMIIIAASFSLSLSLSPPQSLPPSLPPSFRIHAARSTIHVPPLELEIDSPPPESLSCPPRRGRLFKIRLRELWVECRGNQRRAPRGQQRVGCFTLDQVAP